MSSQERRAGTETGAAVREPEEADANDITAARALVERWAAAGPALEEERCRALQGLDDDTARRMTLDLFRLWRPREADDLAAGLVEQQRLFGKLRPREVEGAKGR